VDSAVLTLKNQPFQRFGVVGDDCPRLFLSVLILFKSLAGCFFCKPLNYFAYQDDKQSLVLPLAHLCEALLVLEERLVSHDVVQRGNPTEDPQRERAQEGITGKEVGLRVKQVVLEERVIILLLVLHQRG